MIVDLISKMIKRELDEPVDSRPAGSNLKPAIIERENRARLRFAGPVGRG
jgi:hypothetical protein